jgi:hypothetical protein
MTGNRGDQPSLVTDYVITIWLILVSLILLIDIVNGGEFAPPATQPSTPPQTTPTGAPKRNWSRTGQEHHKSIVHVSGIYPEVGGKRSISRGSGVYVRFGGMRGVLTSAHLIRRHPEGVPEKVVVQFADGTAYECQYSTDKNSNDIAWLFLGEVGQTSASVSNAHPREKDVVEMCSYGGPWGKLRHLRVRVTWYDRDSAMKLDELVMQRDSGGGIFYEGQDADRLCGIIRNGEIALGTTGDYEFYRGTGAVSLGPIQEFITRIYDRGDWRQRKGTPAGALPSIIETAEVQQYCTPGGYCYPCPPGGCVPQYNRNFNIGPQFNIQPQQMQPRYEQPEQRKYPEYDPSLFYPPAITEPEPGLQQPVQPTQPSNPGGVKPGSGIPETHEPDAGPQPQVPSPDPIQIVDPDELKKALESILAQLQSLGAKDDALGSDINDLKVRVKAVQDGLETLKALGPGVAVPDKNVLSRLSSLEHSAQELARSLELVNSRLASLEKRPIYVNLVDAEGKVIQVQEYAPGPNGHTINLQQIFKVREP